MRALRLVSFLLLAMLSLCAPSAAQQAGDADLNSDGHVDHLDLLVLLEI